MKINSGKQIGRRKQRGRLFLVLLFLEYETVSEFSRLLTSVVAFRGTQRVDFC
jgi:hypothetical protein